MMNLPIIRSLISSTISNCYTYYLSISERNVMSYEEYFENIKIRIRDAKQINKKEEKERAMKHKLVHRVVNCYLRSAYLHYLTLPLTDFLTYEEYVLAVMQHIKDTSSQIERVCKEEC